MNQDKIQKLLKERYYLNNENTWEDLSKRVSVIHPPIFSYINEKKFIPSTPTLMNANTNGERKGTLSSCFTMGLEDSIEGIFESVKEAAIVTKAGGGVGYDFSVLRGDQENIKSINANSSGPLPFANIFNATLDGIMQGGKRRGAGMGMLDITHPNILEFIRIKNNKGMLERLNLSIRITDEFYDKLKQTPNAPHYVKNKKNGLEYVLEDKGKQISVKQLWDEIIEYAWRCAEPGIVNISIAERQCSTKTEQNQILTNPCQPAFATVLTKNGIRTIGDVEIGDEIWSGKQWTTITNKWFTGNKQVNSYNTSAGSFIGTENHRIVENGKKIEVKNASSIDKNTGNKVISTDFNVQDIMDGLMIGDGSYHKASNNLVFLCIGENDKDYFTSEISSLILKDRTAAFKGWEVKTTIDHYELPPTYERKVPDRFFYGEPKVVVSFLRGLYSANGSICGDRVTLKQSSKTLITQVQIMLSSVGIASYITTNKPTVVKFANGTYECKQSYDLNITSDREIFKDTIGYIQQYKQNKLEEIVDRIKVRNKKNTYDITIIEDLGFHDVFDITVDAEEHTYWTGGLLVSNCSEYVNEPYSSCNLGSINLTKMVNNDGTFNWKEFEKTIRVATRFLNNVIDVNDFPLFKIKEKTLEIRPIGLGVMGYAHMFYMMNIPFNSNKAKEITNDIFNYLTMISMLESIEIAKETKKTYPVYDYERFTKANSRFLTTSNVFNIEEIKLALHSYGIANSCFTSIAPTGSISYLCDTSGGIEPVFALTYSRKIEKLNKEYEIVFITDPIFDKYLTDNFDEKTKIKVLEQVANNKGSCQKVKEIPEDKRKVFVVASDLSPMEHLESLAIVARNTSMSVSKTINLSSDATKEEISEVYIKAHEMGVIGVTVYRDGCRDGILVHNVNNNSESIVKNNAPKRPKSLPCHVYRFNILNRTTNEAEKWIIFVGLLNDDPYEIIAGKIDKEDFDNSILEGEMVKTRVNGKKVYQFKHNGEVLVDDVCSVYLNELREYITRLMSLALRHGCSIEYLKEVLQKSNGTIVDFNKAVIRAINKYTKDMKSKEKCPVCNSDLIYVESCIKCASPDCSYTKCG